MEGGREIFACYWKGMDLSEGAKKHKERMPASGDDEQDRSWRKPMVYVCRCNAQWCTDIRGAQGRRDGRQVNGVIVIGRLECGVRCGHLEDSQSPSGQCTNP